MMSNFPHRGFSTTLGAGGVREPHTERERSQPCPSETDPWGSSRKINHRQAESSGNISPFPAAPLRQASRRQPGYLDPVLKGILSPLENKLCQGKEFPATALPAGAAARVPEGEGKREAIFRRKNKSQPTLEASCAKTQGGSHADNCSLLGQITNRG